MVVGDETTDARVAVALDERSQFGVVDGVLDVERTRTEITDRGALSNGLVEVAIVAVGVLKLRHPPDARAIEDQFHLVAVGFGELVGGFQRVRESAVTGV